MGRMYRQIGNAVAVLFARKIGEEFAKIEQSNVKETSKKVELAI